MCAPTDDAFDNMPATLANWLKENPSNLDLIAAFHIINPEGWPQDADLTTDELIKLELVQSRVLLSPGDSDREYLIVSQSEAGLKIGEALIIDGNIDASNGIIHAIDTVLIPQIILEEIP